MAVPINNSFFQDHLANVYFFYTGKTNVLGIQHPDSSILNDKDYKWTRIGVITYDLADETTETCVDETLTIALENDTSEGYENSIINRVHILGIVKGNRVVKSTFKCACEPVFTDTDVLEIHLTEETTTTNGLSTYCLGIWVKTENCNKIFITMDNSHSINTVPLNEYCFSSGYELTLLKEDTKEADTSMTDLDTYVQASSFCTGENIFSSILNRLTALENRSSYNFSYATVTYDIGFTPISTGSDALLPQIITPSNISYRGNISPFLKLSTAGQYFTVQEAGSYLFQLNSKFSGSTGRIQITITNNNDIVAELVYDPSYSISSLTTPLVVLNVDDSNVIRVKFTFVDGAIDDVVNEGTTMMVMRLL